MKILLLMTDVWGASGGIPTFNRALLSAMAQTVESGTELRLLVLNDPPDAFRPVPGLRMGGRAFGGRRFSFIRAVLQESQWADQVFLGHVHFSPLAWILRRSRIRLVLHGIEAWVTLPWWRQWGLRFVDVFLPVSQYTRDLFCTKNGIDKERCALFPDTLISSASSAEHSSRSDLGLPAQGPMILTVSRLSPQERYKRIDEVLQAMPAVLQRHPHAFYVVVGEGGYRESLTRLAGELGIAHRVFFPGFVPESRLPAYYAQSTLFVLPSTGEGFGIVFLEAMQQALACIGARAGAVPEVIEEGITGLMVSAGDINALSEAICRLLSNDPLRRQMGVSGQERYLRLFSPERFRERVSNLFSAVADASRSLCA